MVVVKKYSTITGKRTDYAILCNGAYIFYGTKKACENMTRGSKWY